MSSAASPLGTSSPVTSRLGASFRSLPALLALAVLPWLIAACGETNGAAPTAEPPKPVKVAQVRYAEAASTLRLPGTSVARIETTAGFRVSGKVTERLVELGQWVPAGAVIARLDPRDLRLAVEGARARAREAEAELSQARIDLERIEQLRGGQAFTKATFDQRRTAVTTANARLETARSTLRTAENQATYAELKTDTAGVVTAVLAEPGQVVAQGQGIVKLALDGEREVLVGVPENRLGDLRRATRAVAILWSDADTRLPAILRELSPVADPATRTYAARFALPGAPADLPLGLTVTIELNDKQADRVAALPSAALFHDAGRPAVWVVDIAKGGVSLRPVEIAGYRAEQVLIARGLEDGETVVAAGPHKLSADSHVKIWR